VPAVVAGAAYLWAGSRLQPLALATAIAGVAAAYGLALRLTRGRGEAGEPSSRTLLRLQTPGLVGVTCYGFCAAALLLHAEAPYLLHRLDIAVAVAPLIAAMGFVEWRAERFRDRKAPSGIKDDQLDAWSFADALRSDGQAWRPLLPAFARTKARIQLETAEQAPIRGPVRHDAHSRPSGGSRALR